MPWLAPVTIAVSVPAGPSVTVSPIRPAGLYAALPGCPGRLIILCKNVLPGKGAVTGMWQRAARLRTPAVAGWLTDIVPAWLVTAVRPQRVPVPWGEMVRAAIAICVPLAAGIASGQRVLGLLVAMGGLLGIVVDNGGPYAHRVRRVSSAAVFGGAAGLVIGSLIHGRGWIAVVALVVVAGVSALLSAISDVGSVTGLQLLVYSTLGLGAFGALRPWWHTALGFVLGTVWALILTVPGWLLSPRAAERHSVAAVYHALAGEFRAAGTPGFAAARRGATAAMNSAYDTLLTARSTAGGRNAWLMRMVAMLNQANLIAEAATTLSLEGNRPPAAAIGTLDDVADAIAADAAPPAMPPVPGTSPGAVALRDGLSGVGWVLSRKWAPPAAQAAPKPPLRDRLGALSDRLTSTLTRRFAIRLMVCVGVAAVVSEVLPLQRSYWVVLTVAIVLKPDFGSVFARAVQRGLGTVVGAVLGAVIIAAVPYGPWLLIPFGLLAALLPYGRSRNFGLQAVFLTPLVVVLIDLLAADGWRLAEDRLVDTLLGCAIVLLIGYAPWPASWQANLPGKFADAIRDVSRYLQVALTSTPAERQETGSGGEARPGGPGPGGMPDRIAPRRQARRAVSDLRAEFERTMSEPQPVSRRATAWWPAVVGLDEVMDAVTATAVAVDHGAPAPAPDAVARLAAALGSVAAAVEAGVAPSGPPELPSDEPLQPVTEAVRAVLGVMCSPKGRAPEPEDAAPQRTA
jgi:uncharacterized membrane protein YccC